MRHLGSILLSLALAPVIWVLAGIGTVKISETANTPESEVLATMIGILALLGAGFVYAPLVLTRLSPLGPALVGLGFIGASVWLHRDPAALPAEVFGVDGVLQVPVGYAAVLAVPLMLTLLSPRRWRRYAEPPVQSGLYPGTPQPATAFPAYPLPQPGASSPAYEQTTPLYPPPAPPASQQYPPPAPPVSQQYPPWPPPEDPEATRKL